jgi:poly-gamma-glutamate synthesis protein (capsule biosynthesis protein)
MARVLIGADICPIGGNTPYFREGNAEALFHDLLPEFQQADLVIANLECPLIEKPTPISKTGPTFGEESACIRGIRAAGIDVLSLANNHILDHGPEGLANTLAVCERAGVATVGAGPDLAAAGVVLVRQAGNLRVGIVAMAEHEFSIATAATAGANPLDLITFVRRAAEIRKSVDYLVVLVHGGHEFLSAPSPRLRETCRFLVEMGAQAVILQHPHALGGIEEYRGGQIVYGQGALVMDEPVYRARRSFHESVLIALTIADDGTSTLEPLPVVQSDPVPGARRMEGWRAEKFLAELAVKSRAILDDDYIDREWKRFCEEREHGYLNVLLGHNRVLSRANRKGGLARLLYGKRRMLGARNVVCCETHREALETIFKQRG